MAAGLVAIVLVLAPFVAGAQPSLYGVQPPAGAAFLRFVNATGVEVTARAEGLPTLVLPPSGIGVYRTLVRADRALALEARVGAGAARAAPRVAGGAFVTVLVSAGAEGPALRVVTDVAGFNQARAHLAFYNALPDCPAASLLLDPDGPAILAEVPPGEMRGRAVNPARATLRALCGERSAALELDGMEAGGRYSAWFLPGADGPRAVLTRDPVPGGWQPRSR